MATSSSTNYSTSASAIINGALRLVGALSQGESPTADQSSEALEALNMMVKALSNKDLPLWAIGNTVVPLTSTNSYTIGVGKTVNTAKPLKVLQAFYRDSTNSVDTNIEVISRSEYEGLSNKSSTGRPISVYYEPLRDHGVAHIYPTPDAYSIANIDVYLVNQRAFEDFDSTADEPDFPQEWFEALKYGLAVRLAGDYGVDMRKKAVLMQEAKMYLDDALYFTQEVGSIYVQAEKRD